MEDRDAIQRLIADSARRLSREHYTDLEIETAIETDSVVPVRRLFGQTGKFESTKAAFRPGET